MSIKISFLHYMKWTRVMLPVVFEEFEVVCILLAVFSFHYNCQLVRDQQKSGGAAAPQPTRFLRACYIIFLLGYVKPANICFFKVSNRNTRKRCEICSKLTTKTSKRHQ